MVLTNLEKCEEPCCFCWCRCYWDQWPSSYTLHFRISIEHKSNSLSIYLFIYILGLDSFISDSLFFSSISILPFLCPFIYHLLLLPLPFFVIPNHRPSLSLQSYSTVSISVAHHVSVCLCPSVCQYSYVSVSLLVCLSIRVRLCLFLQACPFDKREIM